MRENIELTFSKYTLLGILISLILLSTISIPVRAQQYWYAGGIWDSITNWNYQTHGVEARIQCKPGWVYYGHVNGYVTIEFLPTDTGRWFIEIGWIKRHIFWGAIKWYYSYCIDGDQYVFDQDVIEYGSWHYYRIARDYPHFEWYVYFDGQPTIIHMFYFGGGFIRAIGESVPLSSNELDSYFNFVKYYYNQVWSYWDNIDTFNDPPYYITVTHPWEFRTYGPI